MSEHFEEPTEDGGVGARVRRREDERHLHGKGRFVADYSFPGLQEVAFLRSPVAHARILRIGKPKRHADSIVTRADMQGASDIVADSSLPTYKPSSHPPLASEKVRFAGEPVADRVGELLELVVRAMRAARRAEDLLRDLAVAVGDRRTGNGSGSRSHRRGIGDPGWRGRLVRRGGARCEQHDQALHDSSFGGS